MIARFKIRQLDQNAVPTTSLADMMFLLLIFFIMTTTLTRVKGFVTDIPSGSTTQQQTQEKNPQVALHDGRVSLNDDEISMDELYTRIRKMGLAQRKGEGKVIVLATSGDVPYQDFYQIVAFIQGSGGVVALLREEEGGKK